MKVSISSCIVCFFLMGQVSFGQDDRYFPISLMELMANPEKLSGKIITIRGFIQIQHEPRELTAATLYLHEEDAKHSLYNGIGVSVSKQMIRDKEKLNRRYVSLTGRVTMTPTASGWHIITLTDIQTCMPLE
jgi:hypothetical protein